MNYSQQEKIRATAWKNSTKTLPEEATKPASYVNKDGSVGRPPYAFCLPSAYASFSLLPEVREEALALFADLGIPWHAGVGGGPSNHLVSSQVQCVNALGQMVADPARVIRAFGDLVDIDEVLQIEPGRHLTFEYIGPTDFFDEAPKGTRIRGAHCTSVDAAFLHRARDGVIELVLVEWKYTESYQVRRPDPTKDKTRLDRYGSFVSDPTGPVRSNVLAFEMLLDEPFYQLVRQQLLAHELERSQAEGATRVRILHVLSPQNLAYQESLARPEHRTLGDTVTAVWHQLLRAEDRFMTMDPEIFLDPEITSSEYVMRYSEEVAHDQQELFKLLDVTDADAISGYLDFHGEVVLHDDLVDLVMGVDGTGLSYPFHVNDLIELADELEAGDG